MRLKRILASALAAAMIIPTMAMPTLATESGYSIEDTFYDLELQEYVSTNFDNNHDGYIDEYEIKAVNFINLTGTNVSNLEEVEIFESLGYLYFSNTNVRSLVLDNMPNLLEIRCNNMEKLHTIVLTNCPKLHTISACACDIDFFYCGDSPLMSHLDLSCNSEDLRYIDLTNMPILAELYNNPAPGYSYTGSVEGYPDFFSKEQDWNAIRCNVTTDVITSYPDDAVILNSTNFPDSRFRESLVYWSEGMGYLTKEEADATTSWPFGEAEVVSIKGIELFPNLESIDFRSGVYTSVDLSKNPKLTEVLLGGYITSLDLSKNTKIETLVVESPELTSLDVSMLPDLKILGIGGTGITSIDIRNNPYLVDAYKNGNHGQVVINGVTYESYLIDNNKYGIYFDAGCEIIAEDPAPATPSPTTPSTPAPSAPESEGGVAGFVERLYTVALGRASEPAGKAAWIAAIRRGETGAEVAKGFLFSDEFLNKNMSEKNFVTILYRTFFDRESDQAGIAGWIAALGRGESKQDVIMGFINSTEWANVCVKYGILSGGTGVANITVEPNSDVVAFATRLYTTCLKRSPDQNGLMAWARQLANLRDTGSNAARGFFFSDEMLRANISDEEFLTRLYLTFMDRDPDTAGFRAWMVQLSSGVSREEVFDGFAQSVEFGQICANYGIIR